MSDRVNIQIDGQKYDVSDGQNLLQAVMTLGIDLPYFCWHPALDSVGACRQCAVIQYKDENDDTGKMVMACMVPVEDGMIVSVADEQAVKFRSNIIEWLMVNHPHDCPVCDEGGECHLQDMTVMSGHNYRSYGYTKRTFRNQDLGPFIFHEMNRCITCYRCVRFYRDFAGGKDLDAFGAHDRIYFGRYEEGTLENEFSGNLVEVCPTGVFTDKTLRKHYSRKWDLQSSPSVCQHCSLGCNIFAGERYNKLVRILNRYNGSVNGYFICDRGRFGYEHVNADNRIRQARQRTDGDTRPFENSDSAISSIAACLGTDRVLGIGSPRAGLESNFVLKKLVGDDNFSTGMSAAEHAGSRRITEAMRNGSVNIRSLRDAEKADAVLVLGEDLTNTAPMLALAVRQSVRNQPMKLVDKLNIPRWNDAAVREAVQDRRGPLCIATPYSTKLDELADSIIRSNPNQIARFGFAVAHAIDDSAPEVPGLTPDESEQVQQVAKSLVQSELPLVIGGISLGEPAVIDATLAVHDALRRKSAEVGASFVVPDNNSIGCSLLGGCDLDEAVQRIQKGEVETLVVVENDLTSRIGNELTRELLASVKNVVVLDHTEHFTTKNASIVIPTGTFAESDGTAVNNEGRAQRYFQALSPEDNVKESWRALVRIGIAAGIEEMNNWTNLDPVADAALSAICGGDTDMSVAPNADYRIHGRKVARSPLRYSGRTAKTAHQTVHEQKPPHDDDSPLSYSMEGVSDQPPPSLTSFFWSPGWNSVQALAFYQKEVGQELRGGDPGIRLFEAQANKSNESSHEVPEPVTIGDKQIMIIPVHRIFGSEFLSNRSEPIRERIDTPFCLMNEATAKKLDTTEEGRLSLSIDDRAVELAVLIDDSMADDVVGVMVDLNTTAGLQLPRIINMEDAT